jgi:hypothetical protein
VIGIGLWTGGIDDDPRILGHPVALAPRRELGTIF